jgi:hypothetical protein
MDPPQETYVDSVINIWAGAVYASPIGVAVSVHGGAELVVGYPRAPRGKRGTSLACDDSAGLTE